MIKIFIILKTLFIFLVLQQSMEKIYNFQIENCVSYQYLDICIQFRLK